MVIPSKLRTIIFIVKSCAIETISEQLRRELPGLRGFSATNMKNMRLFYETWNSLDSKSPIAIGDLQREDYSIDIDRSLCVNNVVDFPIDVFFSVPFTHHIRILERTQTKEERCLSSRVSYSE